MDELEQAVAAARWVIRSAAAEAKKLDDLGEPPDWLDLTRLFIAVDDAIADLQDLKKQVGYHAHHSLPGREVVAPEIGPVSKSWPSDRKDWRHDDLFDLMLARARDERELDEETGEYEDLGVVVIRVLRDCVSVGGWKLGKAEEGTGLRGRGIDPDEFSRVDRGRDTISVPSRAKRAAKDAIEALRSSESAATCAPLPPEPVDSHDA